MVFLKISDYNRASAIWEPDMPPRRFMLQMEEDSGTAYWISGVLFWLKSQEENGGCDLNRFFRVQKKIRSVGYAIHEDIPSRWDIILGQMGPDFNKFLGVSTDLRHARYVDESFSDWSVKEVRNCKRAAKLFKKSGERDLTKWCRSPEIKKKGLRERQLLIQHFLEA